MSAPRAAGKAASAAPREERTTMARHAKNQPTTQQREEKTPDSTGQNSPTPADLLVLPARLPQQVRPLSNETLTSYLGRLAVHNGLSYEYFSSRISRMRACQLGRVKE